VYPHSDELLRPQEIGASIFVEANRHLVKAAKVGGSSLLESRLTFSISVWS
jgi:prenylcysteine oxidase/farnesylcysteine lyase